MLKRCFSNDDYERKEREGNGSAELCMRYKMVDIEMSSEEQK